MDEEIEKLLQVLVDSCNEALDGTWDPSGEGSQGFKDMIIIISLIAKKLNIKLKYNIKYDS